MFIVDNYSYLSKIVIKLNFYVINKFCEAYHVKKIDYLILSILDLGL